MARRMYSIDQINSGHDMNLVAGNGININQDASAATISLSLYRHDIDLFSFDESMHAYMTFYSTYSEPVTNKEELINILLAGSESDISATGFAENYTKIIYSIDSVGALRYTDLQGNQGMYIDDYTLYDSVVSLGG